MGKIWVEVCLISGRGLRRSSSLWKLQWFAVGWVDPSSKYCTRIDASNNSNPVWKTKFAAPLDSSESDFNDAALHVEVYSREPIFLRERLQGTATILLKEFLGKSDEKTEAASRPGEVGSYQLRKRGSEKPQGFVDVSVRVSEEKEASSSFSGTEGDTFHGNSITLATGDGPARAFPAEIPLASFHKPQNHTPYALRHPTSGPSYRPPPLPPPNSGYTPALSDNYISMPSSSAAPPPGRAGGPRFAMGMGAGALAAGAMIFGDDFISGFDVPSGFSDPNVVVSTNPPF